MEGSKYRKQDRLASNEIRKWENKREAMHDQRWHWQRFCFAS